MSNRIEFMFYKFRILFVMGSIAIFWSWVIQNFQENNIKTEREELLQKQYVIDHLFDARRVWLESIFTHAAIKKDSVADDQIYFVKVYDYLETSFSILQHVNEALIMDTALIKRKNDTLINTLALCRQYCKTKDYTDLVMIMDYVNSEDSNGYQINQKFSESGIQERAMLKELRDRERHSNNWYSFIYILGSLFIAIDYVISKLKSSSEKNSKSLNNAIIRKQK